MQILINGKPVQWPQDGGERELDRLFMELAERNEIVQDVIVDGVPCTDDYRERILRNAGTIREIEIRTVSGGVAAAELEEELKGYLPKLLAAFDSIPELLYGDMTPEDWGYVSRLLEGIQWVVQSAELLKWQAGKAGDAVRAGWCKAFLDDAAGRLAELDRQLQQSDFIAAGDLLKYELPEAFRTLHGRLAGESA